MAKSKINPNETDAQKIVRLANKRVNKTLGALKQVGNLGAYSPTVPQIELISKTVRTETEKQLSRLKSKTTTDEDGFKMV